MTQAIPDKDGMFKAVVGDGFVMFARFSAQGVEIERVCFIRVGHLRHQGVLTGALGRDNH
jgi:hypothetical protein